MILLCSLFVQVRKLNRANFSRETLECRSGQYGSLTTTIENGPKRQDDIKRVPKRHDDITGNYDIRGEKAGDSNRTLRTHVEDGNKQ